MIKNIQSFQTILPIEEKKLEIFKKEISNYSSSQLAWISGYLWKQATESKLLDNEISLKNKKIHDEISITILSASQTGNARKLSEKMYEDLIKNKIKTKLINARDYNFKKINNEKILLVITSTHGEGEPPEEAIALYKYLFSKRAPSLKNTKFAVFGLGDSSYEHFAKIGKDFDKRLFELGAYRLSNRIDADVDYYIQAKEWRHNILKKIKNQLINNKIDQKTINNFKKKIKNNKFNKTKPFFANLLVNQKITDTKSLKDIRHLEIDLSGSDLNYKPGDSLGVWYENDINLVKKFLFYTKFTGKEIVKIKGKNISFIDALKKKCDLTKNNINFVKNYAFLSKNKYLLNISSDNNKLQEFVKKTPIINIIKNNFKKITPEQIVILLRPLMPRYYSIASSQSIVGEEVHITVSILRYIINGELHTGGASGYLSNKISESDKIKIFIEKNDNFRLPKDQNSPIIMIGPGTGIAPFRSFLQQREADNASGKNWLFFGNPNFIYDFLYQIELQNYVKNGLLTKIDLAWSQDQEEKIFVQDKIRKNGKEFWEWIQNGAYIYVCGNASHMAHDVEKEILNIIVKYANINFEKADEFLNELRIKKRYQRDIY